ncbi:unnamed protein product [Linum trigynum]|uniref:Reverse transcriptase domain-containing protein n=1 Tax=Linum trigynum TaxID=586398 RepID=A0AAV2C9V9_9ROSI
MVEVNGGGNFRNGIGVGARNTAGGLALLWDSNVDFTLKSMSQNHIDGVVKHEDGENVWRFTGFYGWPEGENKSRSWDLLRNLHNQMSMAWVVMGDFNQVVSGNEKRGKRLEDERDMQAFANALSDTELEDLGFVGYPFTWDNARTGEAFTEERLDRAVCNQDWAQAHPLAQVRHHERPYSDHRAVILDTEGIEGEPVRWGWRFKYESYWDDEEECKKIVAEEWERCSSLETAERLRACEQKLHEWSKEKFGSWKERLKMVEKSLAELERKPRGENWIQERRNLEAERAGILVQEEKKWHQRSRISWLGYGDKNSSLFHRRATERKRRNTIRKLISEDGRVWLGQNEVSDCLVDYYSHMFESQGDEGRDTITSTIPRRVTSEMNDWLRRPFTVEEIEDALRHMGPLKAPGEDGFPAIFYKRNWDVIKEQVTEEILQALAEGKLPPKMNRTLICLIPKVKKPKSPKDYRPISLCNVSYKILSKVLANRLRTILHKLISETQSAFVPGRSIFDNVLAAFECFHAMKKKERRVKRGFFAAKLDMAKAYDRVEWHFLRRVMEKLGFERHWINMIMECVSTVTYSVLVNGHQTRSITPSRGLRQGDPISPYLFLLCAEGLSSMIEKAEREGSWHGIKVSQRGPSVSHLLFADDCIFFARACHQESAKIKQILADYERESGQMINLGKSELTFSNNVGQQRRTEIAQHLGIREVSKHEKYLGLPTVVGRSKKVVFAYIKERIRDRIQGWKGRMISTAGKDVLIKAVALAQGNFVMSVFKLPASLIREINSVISNYWWGDSGGKNRIHWKNWRFMGKERAVGGMGLRELEAFNKALLVKQVWQLLQNPNSLIGRILKAKYFPHSSILEAAMGYRPSYTWRSLLSARDLVCRGSRWRVGNGTSIRIWDDKWVPGLEGNKPSLGPQGKMGLDRVKDLIDHGSGEWRGDLLELLFSPVECEAIRAIPIPRSAQADARCWDYTTDGKYTVCTGYKLAVEDPIEEPGVDDQEEEAPQAPVACDWSALWKTQVPPKVRYFLWKVMHDILPTM